MSILQRARDEVSRQYRAHGQFSRSLDRLNRLPLLREFAESSAGVPLFPTREGMWDHVAERAAGPIDFLEFGVHRGHSLLYWARANADPHSRFFGFDTFEGLPEYWKHAYPKGFFDTKGEAPQTDDPRVTFVRGLFQNTLDAFLQTYSPRARRIVHIDCDLYSSTLFCLTKLDEIMAPGTIVIFDEFGDVQHEFRAFNDYTSAYRRHAEMICAHDDFFTAAVEMK